MVMELMEKSGGYANANAKSETLQYKNKRYSIASEKIYRVKVSTDGSDDVRTRYEAPPSYK